MSWPSQICRHSSAWKCVLNFADPNGKQVSKLLACNSQTSCLHGLWFDSTHKPGPLTSADLNAFSKASSQAAEGLPSLFPMHAQKLPGEFARHAAAFMTGEVYIEAIQSLVFRSKDVFLTYGEVEVSSLFEADGCRGAPRRAS